MESVVTAMSEAQISGVELKSRTVYASVGINQCRRVLVVCPQSNLLIYGAAGRLLAYCPDSCSVVGASVEVANGHITCIKNVTNTPWMFLVTYSNGDVSLWENTARGDWSPGRVCNMFTRRLYLKGHHKGSVSCGDATTLSDGSLIIATASVDHTLRICTLQQNLGSLSSSVEVELPYRALVLDLRLITRDSALPFLLYGGDDSKVHILAPSANELTSDESNENSVQTLPPYERIGKLSGHQDWVTAIDVIDIVDSEVMIASGSKDGSVRLWRLQFNSESPNGDTNATAQDDFSRHLEVKPIILNKGVGKVVLETVLCGHEGWVSHLAWMRRDCKCSTILPSVRNLQLVSCGQTEDRVIILWQPSNYVPLHCSCMKMENKEASTPEDNNEEEEVMWLEFAKLGEVGGNREGFYSAMFCKGGTAVCAHSYQGGLHYWTSTDHSWWEAQASTTGHFDSVVDCSWERVDGRYLLSSSLDQTTRLHAPVERNNQLLWREMCRPQVHGYDMSCVASVDLTVAVSGAEEKLLRAFECPSKLLSDLNTLCKWNVDDVIATRDHVQSAAVPALGLSNKSVVDEKTSDESSSTEPVLLTEDSLMASSLWPEACKLYGHGHEIVCVAASEKYLASSCRAAAPIDAGIIIWSSTTYRQLQTLPHHRLTVTQLVFSPDGSKLLAVSRDRTWSLYQLAEDGQFRLLSHSGLLDKKSQHSRIIWSAAWMGQKFVTASRDKTMVVWQLNESVGANKDGLVTYDRLITISLDNEVNAVATFQLTSDKWLMAAGLVDGNISVRSFIQSSATEGVAAPVAVSHHKTVKKLAFKPGEGDKAAVLASCGEDNLTLIHEVKIA